MIKFWKSAAKGKSGCPVRPPEANSTPDATSEVSCLVDTTHLTDDNEDYANIFEKKSKLSLNLHDVLVEKKALKYFIEFMESIGKLALVKCWLELDNFKIMVSNNTSRDESHFKISRTKSVDLQCKCTSNEPQRLNWKDKRRSLFIGDYSAKIKKDSTSSCGNLAEHSNNCELCESKNYSNPTEEAIKLFKKYVALEAPNQLDLPDNLRKSVISNICQPEGNIKGDCFQAVQENVFKQIEKNYFNEFLNTPFYIKAQIEMLTCGSLDFKDILHNETILFYFTEYMEQENGRVLLEFLMAVMHFKYNISENIENPNQIQDDAVIIYEKYISLQATTPIGFPTDIRLKIESDICADIGALRNCFDLPYRIIFNTLSKYVKMFLESELYYKYLSEMIHSMDQISSNSKSYSDCSSEFSLSTQNTLLAMGDPVFRKKKRNHSVPDMTIDSNQLYNADALWQRKKHEGLNIGRVNSLGRFESKFEPDPDKKDKSVLKKMVSKFVPTARVEEEMAWQIAHMIVKDVTDLTMAPPDNENDV